MCNVAGLTKIACKSAAESCVLKAEVTSKQMQTWNFEIYEDSDVEPVDSSTNEDWDDEKTEIEFSDDDASSEYQGKVKKSGGKQTSSFWYLLMKGPLIELITSRSG